MGDLHFHSGKKIFKTTGRMKDTTNPIHDSQIHPHCVSSGGKMYSLWNIS